MNPDAFSLGFADRFVEFKIVDSSYPTRRRHMNKVTNHEETSVKNEDDRTHPEMSREREHHERQAGIIDKHGNRVHPAATFMLVGMSFAFVSAIMLTLLLLVF